MEGMMAHFENLKIVTIGAGTGQAKMLTGLKNYFKNLTAIVSVTDNGGHSGTLRKELKIPQPGDSRNCLVALADPESPWTRIFDQRLINGELSGVSIGNLIIGGLAQETGDFAEALKASAKLLKIQGRVLPSTTENTQIACQLEDGRKIIGEWQIMERGPRSKISRLFLEPPAKAYPESLVAIREADFIIFAAGTLRTGTVSNLLPEGIPAAFQETDAKIICVANLMTQPGQTDGMTAFGHAQEIARYSGQQPDYLIVNTGKISGAIIEHYRKYSSHPVEIDGSTLEKTTLIEADLVPPFHIDELAKEERIGPFKKWTHLLWHDPEKLAQEILSIVERET